MVAEGSRLSPVVGVSAVTDPGVLILTVVVGSGLLYVIVPPPPLHVSPTGQQPPEIQLLPKGQKVDEPSSQQTAFSGIHEFSHVASP